MHNYENELPEKIAFVIFWILFICAIIAIVLFFIDLEFFWLIIAALFGICGLLIKSHFRLSLFNKKDNP
ncbi:hypothetical protein F4V57_06725 [Acinetobacter qingfengensis]|uniref:Uncharacterized protein n=2 Tax=Acinetobacter qingfengensis TaxID=1262585 RepID=A0A1E7R403_9GAMM|nr:hypothetical protein [Acinetobacter qingfengensis]KAA8733744.1 hypothetical protein F4V57_06725 [Acinetobacter qingfengensis]OEY94034.1 hypothetical protein BJI46_13590 [Acinetobacter qingfengensis]